MKCGHEHRNDGWTENAGVDIDGVAKKRGWTLQEWTIKEQITGVDIAGVDIAGVDIAGVENTGCLLYTSPSPRDS